MIYRLFHNGLHRQRTLRSHLAHIFLFYTSPEKATLHFGGLKNYSDFVIIIKYCFRTNLSTNFETAFNFLIIIVFLH